MASPLLYSEPRTKTRLYKCWMNMRARCRYQSTRRWERYGGRGITVCDEWQTSYEAFAAWAMEHGYEPGLQIDRIDNDGPYSPRNCRWATNRQNNRNNSNNRIIEIAGEQKSVIEWVEDERCTVAANTVYNRLHRGWSAQDAVFTARTAPKHGRYNERHPLPTHCGWGHEWTQTNTYRAKDGTRQCRACNNRRARERRAVRHGTHPLS